MFLPGGVDGQLRTAANLLQKRPAAGKSLADAH